MCRTPRSSSSPRPPPTFTRPGSHTRCSSTSTGTTTRRTRTSSRESRAGCGSRFRRASIPPYDVGKPWAEAREQYAESLLAEIETLLPGFRDQVTFTDTATPETMEHYTLNHRGAIYGWEATPNQSTGKRLKQRAPIDGL